ncbi:MAG: hypothetical protein CSA09_00480 [Candidatus Contendobacter odensis]|uniref:Type 4 fimbrial biogenesis protein PilX N-terminal domain-containing protein n=1 Tax=Candidatus Contendibacter odensensis TaxID=1400860 RepID=A0A2G6PGL2_9GAMM|nr:MAG: hypothetical protein CSA09_00480 [Candidatus Contendobacter odensis]
MRQNPFALPQKQRGAALIVGLILMTVITLVGVTAMQGTTLQEKMAGNLRDSNLSFQASEAALRNCEQLLQNNYLQQVNRYDANLPPNQPPILPARDVRVDVDGDGDGNAEVSTYFWTLDESQAGAAAASHFPAMRLDTDQSNGKRWWLEATRDQAWWDLAASHADIWANRLPNATLGGVIAQPDCIMETYVYAPADSTPEARALKRMRFIDGISFMSKNEERFHRERNYFRMTSRAVGGSSTATTMLQTSVYQVYYAANP